VAKKTTNSTPKKRGRPPLGWKAVFLEALRNTPVVRVACHKASVDRATAYNHKAKDAAFSDAWEEAIQDALDLCELEVHRRAAQGIEKPIYYQGVRIDTLKEYSDNLLMFFLKGYRPERFRDNFDFGKLIEAMRGQSVGEPQPGPGRKGRA
jgi:hypothetical protein